MDNTVANIEDIPKGYFRIHWPQSQRLMDIPGYDEDVIHCVGGAAIDDLSTVALPYKWMDTVEEQLGKKTKFYLQVMNQKHKLN